MHTWAAVGSLLISLCHVDGCFYIVLNSTVNLINREPRERWAQKKTYMFIQINSFIHNFMLKINYNLVYDCYSEWQYTHSCRCALLNFTLPLNFKNIFNVMNCMQYLLPVYFRCVRNIVCKNISDTFLISQFVDDCFILTVADWPSVIGKWKKVSPTFLHTVFNL